MEHACIVGGAEFLTPEQFAREHGRRMVLARGRLVIASRGSGSGLASRVVHRHQNLMQQAGGSAEVMCLADIDRGFADTETGVRLDEHVGGSTSYHEPAVPHLAAQHHATHLGT